MDPLWDTIYPLVDQLDKRDLIRLVKYLKLSIEILERKEIIDLVEFNLNPNNNEGNRVAYCHHVYISNYSTENGHDLTIGCLKVPYRVIVEAHDIHDVSDAHIIDNKDSDKQAQWVKHFDYELEEKDFKSVEFITGDSSDWDSDAYGDPIRTTGIVNIFIYYHKNIKENGPYVWIKNDGSITKVEIKDGKLYDLSRNLISGDFKDYCLSWNGY